MEESPPDAQEPHTVHKLLNHNPGEPNHITIHRLDIASDVVLPASFLGITFVGVIFVLVILVLWWRNHAPWRLKNDNKMDCREFDAKICRDPPKITKEESEKEKLQFKYVNETELVNPTVVKTINYGGSTPKVSEKEEKDEKLFVFPPQQEPQPGSSKELPVDQTQLKIPLPEQTWLSKKSFNCKPYSTTIPRQLVQVSKSELGEDLVQERRKKFSATRSPSLEKDDKSPFMGSASYDRSEVFGFDAEKIKQVTSKSNNPVVEINVQPQQQSRQVVNIDRNFNNNVTPISPKFPMDLQRTVSSNITHLRTCSLDAENEYKEKSNLRRFRSVNTKLNICSTADIPAEIQQENSDVRNLTKTNEYDIVTENPTNFNFSPKLLSENQNSPKFFTPTDKFSPRFFPEGSPKSVYYDSVRSPKFFPDTPRSPANHEDRSSLSPKTFTAQNIRNSPKLFGMEQHSPRILQGKPRSPKIYSGNKENYFNFESRQYEIPTIDEIDNIPVGRKPNYIQCYAGRKSIERDRVSTSEKLDIRKYRRHNSCDTYNKNVDNGNNVSINFENEKSSKISQAESKADDVVDCSIKLQSVTLSPKEQDSETLSANFQAIQQRRHRLKSISLDSDNAKVIEQNLGLPIAKHIKQDNLNVALQDYCSNYNVKRSETCAGTGQNKFTFDTVENSKEDCKDCFSDNSRYSPDLTAQKKSLRDSSDPQSFLDMPRFSPKEFEIILSDENQSDAQKKKASKNVHNLTIDLTRRDSDLEREQLEFEKLYCDTEDKKVKTPTLKIKATSLDSSESMNLSLPQKKTLEVPQNSVSVPNTPKRQYKRILAQKNLTKGHEINCGGKIGYNSLQCDQRRFIKWQPAHKDSGIFLKENHANLMLYQPSCSRASLRMGSFDENISDLAETPPEINVNEYVSCSNTGDSSHLGSNLLSFKQNLSVSSTNLKTLPEGEPSNDFEETMNEKNSKKLNRRGSNQSLKFSTDQGGKYSTLSLQSSNCSLSSAGLSCHNLSSMRNSASNYSLNTDNRQKLLERRNSNTSLTLAIDHSNPKVIGSSNIQPSHVASEVQIHPAKNCLLQRRGSNNSLTLNIQNSSTNLNRFSSNSSLNINKDNKPGHRKGLLERRSSNTSLTLNINNSNPQLSTNKSLSISNYNLNASACNLSIHNSSQSLVQEETKKGILERRSSNTSLTINIQNQEVPREVEVDENALESTFIDQHLLRDRHRKSLSTENLIPKSYKNRNLSVKNNESVSFGSHDDLWSNSYITAAMQDKFEQKLTYVGGDEDNEIIYALGAHQSFEGQAITRNITTKPLSPQTTSKEFKTYLANIQHLQNASSVLTRKQLQDLNNVFQNGYSKVKCDGSDDNGHRCSPREPSAHPHITFPETEPPCSEYQKLLLRNLHKEFWDLPSNFQEKPMVFGSHPKNRYKTILPNEHSRVILKSDGPESEEGYVNANFIKGHEYTKNSYIATQGPLLNTVYDFWLMVHQNNYPAVEERNLGARPKTDKVVSEPSFPKVQKIVMLTNLVENNRHKCEKYFPMELDEEIVFENPEDLDYIFSDPSKNKKVRNCFTITNKGVLQKTGYTIRRLDVSYKHTKQQSSHESEGGVQEIQTIPVYHYWFHNWADHKCPSDVNSLLSLSLDILNSCEHNFDLESQNCQESKVSANAASTKFVFPPLEPDVCGSAGARPLPINWDEDGPPTIVHCSAGIGRTGCLIAILNGIKQLHYEHKVDILGIVSNMRLNRGGMVQNSEQYELIHKVVCLYEQIYCTQL